MLGSLLFGLDVANQPITVHAAEAGTTQEGNKEENIDSKANDVNQSTNTQQQNSNELKSNQTEQKVVAKATNDSKRAINKPVKNNQQTSQANRSGQTSNASIQSNLEKAKSTNTLELNSAITKNLANLAESKVVNKSASSSKATTKSITISIEENLPNDRHLDEYGLDYKKDNNGNWKFVRETDLSDYNPYDPNKKNPSWKINTKSDGSFTYVPEGQQEIADGYDVHFITPDGKDTPVTDVGKAVIKASISDIINWKNSTPYYRFEYYPLPVKTQITFINSDNGSTVGHQTISGRTGDLFKQDIPSGYVLDTSKSSDVLTKSMDKKNIRVYVTTTIHLTNSVSSNEKMPTNGNKYPSDVTNPTNFKQSVKRTIAIDIPNGKPQIINQEVDFTRTANITKEGILTWSNWTPASGTLASVKVPEFAGYTASVKEVPAIKDVTRGQKVDNVTVTYTKNLSPTTSDNSNNSSSTSTQLNPSVPENTNSSDNNTSTTQTQPTTATVSNTSSDQTTNNSSVSTKVIKPAVKRLVLTHNAFVYTKSGRLSKKNGRIITWKRGRNVSASSKIVMIGSKKFYKVGKNAYIKVSNTVEKKLRAFRLTHNAKVYKLSRGKMVAIKNASLKKGFVVKALYNGNGIKNHGAVYYCIGKNRYIKAGNTVSKK